MKNITFLKTKDLILDINNPRFGELYTGSHKEEDLIEYLLFNEAAISVAERLSTVKEFYIDKPLLVIEVNKKYIVKDGNRRCAAVKALINPRKYGINLPAHKFKELPVVIYKDKKEIESRIVEEHTNNMFRAWDRIAKAIELYRQFESGSSIESMEEIDSDPAKLIKLASFYYKAVNIGGDDLKKLLRKGRGDTGGKTTIFERLFRHVNFCGYRFKNKPYYTIEITDKKKFKRYIKAIIKYLIENPSTTYRDVDTREKIFFNAIGLSNLLEVGEKTTILKDNSKKYDIDNKYVNKSQLKPQHNRTIPMSLKKVIDECYSLNSSSFANAKIAMSRVVFECCLKYVVEETKYNNKYLKEYNHFKHIFPDENEGRKWTNFKKLKNQFEILIINKGKKQAFEKFDLESLHPIIHNYNITGLNRDAKDICGNLIPIVEFILDSEANLIKNIDTRKLI